LNAFGRAALLDAYLQLNFLVAGDFASAEATKGLSDRPLETFGADTPMFLDLYCCLVFYCSEYCFQRSKRALTKSSFNKAQ